MGIGERPYGIIAIKFQKERHPVELQPENSFDDLLATRAAACGERAAILGLNRAPLSYARLYELAAATVRDLNRMGIGRGDRVAIVLPNGPEMASAFIGVAAGCASAPLNPAYLLDDFDFYLTDLEARAVIVLNGWETPARDVAHRRGIRLIELTPDPAVSGMFTLQGDSGDPPAQPGFGHPDDPGLILHTSGTTSRPKMVPLTQANLCASAEHIRKTLQLTPGDRCLNVMPLFHIHGLMAAVMATLTAGGSVFCTPGFNSARFFEWFETAGPTWYTAVPTMHQAVLAQAPGYIDSIRKQPLRFVRSSSASLPPSVMSALEDTFGAPVIEAYGMTEAAHQMASNPLPPRPRKPGSVGVAAGPEVAIMGGEGELLTNGLTGEIVIRGPNVMMGYHNNPSANTGAFSGGWFRTGDEGYFDPDGYLYITGRLKEMINRGGEKVAPREVDEVFLEHPAIVQAVTFGVRHPTLGEDVATAVVLRSGAAVDLHELRRYALDRLAPHKAPSRVIAVNEIPKGPTGKLQRIGLADRLSNELRVAYAPPATELEEALARMWTELLGTTEIGREDNFFALGGDSLQATQLIARISTAFEIDLPVGSIFRNPTLIEQAVLVEDLLVAQLEESDGLDEAVPPDALAGTIKS